jgi:thiamine kinase-like enzyme
MKNGEIVSAFETPSKYSNFKAKPLNWIDTGNLDDLNNARKYFNDNPLSLYKATDEIVYKDNGFIKFNPDTEHIKNKAKRASVLKNLIPSGFKSTSHFISYEWEPGNTLYEHNSVDLYKEFINFLDSLIKASDKKPIDRELANSFYIDKTESRKSRFLEKFGQKYLTAHHNINGKDYKSMETVLSSIKTESLYSGMLYDVFHGDLQFDNIVYNELTGRFTYLDWRDSFGGSTDGGDIYYDLSKLYGGCIIPYNIMKKECAVKFSEGSSVITYSYETTPQLDEFKKFYEKWIIDNGYDLDKIKLITAIIFLNMSPLHDEKFGKMLWFKSIELLSEFC